MVYESSPYLVLLITITDRILSILLNPQPEPPGFIAQGTGSVPGTCALRDQTGKVCEPLAAKGPPGQEGVPNAFWTATPNTTTPAGT